MAGIARIDVPPLTQSLSARLLALTVAFVMLAEVLIYLPSIANFRVNWLAERAAAARLAALAIETMPDGAIARGTKNEVLRLAGARAIVLARPDRRVLLFADMPPPVEVVVDLRQRALLPRVGAALGTMLAGRNRVMRVIAAPANEPDLVVEVVLDEERLCAAMLTYSRNVLLLSIVISLITGVLLYLVLRWLVARPLGRIAGGVADFARAPQDEAAGVAPTARRDELGVVQQALVGMQRDVRASLGERARLAALGSAVGKINHDLRGILSTAVLLTDRLATLQQPEVRRLAGPLIQAVDRAIGLCTQTLDFARDAGPSLERTRFRLRDLVDQVADEHAILAGNERGPGGAIANEVSIAAVVEADRDQLWRVFANLARNAFEAGATTVRVRLATAGAVPGALAVDVVDDGPGLAAQARERLFEPFAGSSRRGGTGLGLVIARDVMRAHGGDIELHATGAEGTTFRLTLPLPPDA
ncbi:MAG: sensor histidine kinase [Alphaproteobacteria bacterium]